MGNVRQKIPSDFAYGQEEATGEMETREADKHEFIHGSPGPDF
jgi:hypothetical protein